MKIKQEFANQMDELILKELQQRGYAASPENLAIFEEDVQEAIMARCSVISGANPKVARYRISTTG